MPIKIKSLPQQWRRVRRLPRAANQNQPAEKGRPLALDIIENIEAALSDFRSIVEKIKKQIESPSNHI